MTLYDRLAATPDGARRLAVARLPREILRALHQAQAASGLTVAEISAATGDRRRQVQRAFDGDGNIRPDQLARYLHAMGYELEIKLVPAGEPRRKAIAQASARPGCGLAALADTSGIVDVLGLHEDGRRQQAAAEVAEIWRQIVWGDQPPGRIPSAVPAGWRNTPTWCAFDLDIPARVRVDLNARTPDSLVPAHIDRADRPIRQGETVTAYEPEDGVQAPAVVERIDGPWLHLRVDWDAMDETPAEGQKPLR